MNENCAESKRCGDCGGNLRPLTLEAQTLRARSRFSEANAMLDRAHALAPSLEGYRSKFFLLNSQVGDWEAARLHLEKVPAQLLQKDSFAGLAAQLWIRLGQQFWPGEASKPVVP